MIVGPVTLNHLIQMHGLVTPFEGDTMADSVDMRIGAVFKHLGGGHLKAGHSQSDVGEVEEIKPENGAWILNPNTFYVGKTIEVVNLPPNLAALAMGRSTLMRAGIPVTNGYVDPGYSGEVHFGFRINGERPTQIDFGTRMIQLVFILAELVRPYNGTYQGGKMTPKE